MEFRTVKWINSWGSHESSNVERLKKCPVKTKRLCNNNKNDDDNDYGNKNKRKRTNGDRCVLYCENCVKKAFMACGLDGSWYKSPCRATNFYVFSFTSHACSVGWSIGWFLSSNSGNSISLSLRQRHLGHRYYVIIAHMFFECWICSVCAP